MANNSSPGAEGRHQQPADPVPLHDAVDDHDEGTGRPPDLHRRAAQRSDDEPRDDGRPQPGLGRQTTGDGKRHGQWQCHHADSQACTDVTPQACAVITRKIVQQPGTKPVNIPLRHDPISIPRLASEKPLGGEMGMGRAAVAQPRDETPPCRQTGGAAMGGVALSGTHSDRSVRHPQRDAQRTRIPGAAPSWGCSRNNPGWPPSVALAASTMPSLTPNFIWRGARLATITVSCPTSCSGV
jgi:hypothetical protein